MTDRLHLLEEALANRILCLDGATGTGFQDHGLTPEDFGGELFDGCNEHLVLTRPDIVLDLHRSFLEAGADIIETNSFGSTPLVLGEYPPLGEKAYEISRKSAELARKACADWTSDGRPRFVAGSMGPTTRSISVTGGVTFDELQEHFSIQAQGLLDGGADYLLLETCQDTLNIKAALLAIEGLSQSRRERIGVAVSGTIEATGTMLAGQSAEALAVSLRHAELLYIGLNCATGPEFMTDHVRALASLACTRIACVPNAGLPDEDGNYLETPEMMASILERFVREGWINLVGGCCGTTTDHIRALARVASQGTPRQVPEHHRALYSGIDWVESTEANRPLLVGERTNVIGSRKFKRLISSESWEEASEIGRAQVKKGGQIVDVCLADPDRDERADTERFLQELIKKVKAPLMVDSTDASVIEGALKWCQGRSIINSVNLEDGEERFQEVVPMARSYGASLVVGCIDEDPEQGMAVTRQRKLEVAQRSAALLTEKYGMAEEDLIFDPLVFPCATGDVAYLGSALETIEGLRLIKEHFPRARTILGISNVSFGLPPAGREVLNSVFLYECTRAGLDLAIVNTEKLERYASIPEDERALAEELLLRTSDEAVAAFTEHFRGADSRIRKDPGTLTLDERLSNCVVEGTKEGLFKDLDEKLQSTAPLDIINGPLMAGMDEVGRLFNNNELIVAEVLQSAEAMKAAVAHLEPHMDQDTAHTRGKVLLATVKGDVHDIGKNLVEIVLANNGYEVVNLGIKVPPQQIIDAVREHSPDILGLSGLLVKSAQMMVVTAQEMSERGIGPDLLVGGAALTRSFTRRRIAPAYGGDVLYASDAMDGLSLVQRLLDDDQRPALMEQVEAETQKFAEAAKAKAAAVKSPEVAPTAEAVTALAEVPSPPDFDRHVLRQISLDEVWGWINPKMLYGRHLGFRGNFQDRLSAGDETARDLDEAFSGLKAECRQGRMKVGAVWQWFEADSDGDQLSLYRRPNDKDPAVTWSLPRRKDGRSGLPGWVRSRDYDGGRDTVALLSVTAGSGIREWSSLLKEQGEYLRSHCIQALALETAEALAEWLHSRIRGLWGFPDAPELSIEDRFKARYRARRYSPGYPSCPDLAMQEGLFDLLKPVDIGIELTDGHMMDPEASVSAIVLHHPEARYFS
ncbi:MAG TPA: methionine synthase [Deltaproteobacteria bacterium]|nr:methionine synthase [Deltaproteobacteria bacterium]HCP48102.1 methionine synthase [Deltaproteobacteria bacterium]